MILPTSAHSDVDAMEELQDEYHSADLYKLIFWVCKFSNFDPPSLEGQKLIVFRVVHDKDSVLVVVLLASWEDC